MLIAHLADTHIGAMKYGLTVLRDDIREMLEESLELLAREHVRLLLLAGDVFDTARPRNEDLSWAIRFWRRVTEEAGLRVVAIPGEHDIPGRRDHTMVDVLSTAVPGILNPVRAWAATRSRDRQLGDPDRLIARLDGVEVHAVPTFKMSLEKRRDATRRILDALARRAGRRAVLLLHAGLMGHTHEDDAVLEPADLPGAYRYAALGHVHKRILEARGEPVYAYPGSLVPLSTDEIPREPQAWERGPLLVDLSGDEASVTELRVQAPRHYLVVDTSYTRMEERVREALARLPRSRRPPLVHLRVTLDSPAPGRSGLEEEVARLSERTGAIIRVAKIRKPPSPGLAGAASGGGPLSEEDIVASLLGGDRELARLVLELKRTVLLGDLEGDPETQKRVDEIVEEILRRGGLPLHAPKRPAARARREAGPRAPRRPRGGGGLERWIGG